MEGFPGRLLQEDEKLRDLVDQFGPKRWSDISKQLGTKGPKQVKSWWLQLGEHNMRRRWIVGRMGHAWYHACKRLEDVF